MMSAHEAHLLFLLNGATYETMDGISMNRHERARLVRYLAAYYGQHAVNFPALQSLDILQDLFFVG
jgi:hypothetical protein